MAKSTRSKVKRTFRRDKREREGSAFAVNDAARLARLSAKLRAKFEDGTEPDNGEAREEDGMDTDGAAAEDGTVIINGTPDDQGSIPVNAPSSAPSKKISTSGPRLSRRTEWRMSKGMGARPKRSNTLNKQGAVPGKRKPGRSHRRR